jgi:hypothetical protein
MANTATFIINGTRYIDNQCFSMLSSSPGKVVIEPHKFSLDRKLIIEYIRDLRSIYNFTYKTINGDIIVDLESIPQTEYKKRILLSMLLRFIWEGFYKPVYSKIDNFYKILPVYFKLKEYTNEKNKFKLLLIACNWFINQKYSYNTNHFLVDNRSHCKTNIDFDTLTNQPINTFFATSNNDKDIKVDLKTKNDYITFYEKFKNLT